ncbi:DUF2207 domain-containing protein, partial [Litorimonas haliclonae]|uniref:DUF2207 domain-containing protein n=1 Tax=Litorimonas haliclonae TaxID=2081977 RepID=UPI0039EEDDF2
MRQFLLSFLIALFWGVSGHAQQVNLSGEHISEFDVQLELLTSGDVKVTENITIQDAPGQNRRGIFRELPATKYVAEYDVLDKVQYDMKSISRDGEAEPFEENKINNAWQWRIGDADIYLPNGQHTYQLVYTVENEIRYREDFDELLWNVTGNYWNYPVAKARVRVKVPAEADVLNYTANTGRIGADGNNFTSRRAEGELIFETRRPLSAGEGLTVSVTVPKGQIDGLTGSDLRRYWWLKNGALLIITLFSLGIFAFYFWQWDRVGRDPAKQPVFARYEPPSHRGKNYSAAASHRILRRGLSGNTALIATLINLSVKGWIEMKINKKSTTFTKAGGAKPKAPLMEDEKVVFDNLFKPGKDYLKLDKSPNTHFDSMRSKFEKHLNECYSKDYHRVNAGWIILGILLSVIGIVMTLTQLNTASSYVVLAILVIVVMNVVFLILLPAPTKLGQSVRAEIEGFKLYMETAEKGRLNAVEVGSGQAPPMTKERYEMFLPYAVALNVEKPWTKYFEKTLPDIAKDYQPSYAHGNALKGGFGGNSLNALNRSMVKSLSTGVQSARPVSTSSSGGGGGFSGGGGG